MFKQRPNLEVGQAGLHTTDGRDVRIICTDDNRYFPTPPVIALVDDGFRNIIVRYSTDGTSYSLVQAVNDGGLFSLDLR